jgi:CDGSH-type Zn-finger protein
MPSQEMGNKIKILENGPYLVSGNVPLYEKLIVVAGGINEYRQGREFPQLEEYALCRCGHSKNPPYCDGSHESAGFDGTETASRKEYANRASMQEGPALYLMDDNRCAYARFCHKKDGSVWELTDNSDDPHLRDEAIRAACDCPSGRLVALDEDENPIEPHFEPSVTILQDTEKGVSSGIFVKGNIPIEAADGQTYEIRNRVMLCRCGNSCNKPFCDATHVPSNFSDAK